MSNKFSYSPAQTKRMILDFFRILILAESTYAIASRHYENTFGVTKNYADQLVRRQVGSTKWDILERLLKKPKNKKILQQIDGLLETLDLSDEILNQSITKISDSK